MKKQQHTVFLYTSSFQPHWQLGNNPSPHLRELENTCILQADGCVHCLQDERLVKFKIVECTGSRYLLAICHDCKSKHQQQYPKFPFKPPHCNVSHLAPSGYWPVWVKLQGKTFWHIATIALQIAIHMVSWFQDVSSFRNNTKIKQTLSFKLFNLRHQISLLGVGLRHHHLSDFCQLKLRIWRKLNEQNQCTHRTTNFSNQCLVH